MSCSGRVLHVYCSGSCIIAVKHMYVECSTTSQYMQPSGSVYVGTAVAPLQQVRIYCDSHWQRSCQMHSIK